MLLPLAPSSTIDITSHADSDNLNGGKFAERYSLRQIRCRRCLRMRIFRFDHRLEWLARLCGDETGGLSKITNLLWQAGVRFIWCGDDLRQLIWRYISAEKRGKRKRTEREVEIKINLLKFTVWFWCHFFNWIKLLNNFTHVHENNKISFHHHHRLSWLLRRRLYIFD